MTNDILVSMSTNRNEVEIGKEIEIRIKIPKTVGTCSDLRILFNRFGENPSIIQYLRRKDDTEEYYTNVEFNLLGNYYFFFDLKINGEYQTIKINRKTNKPFITKEESPYWRLLVIQKEFEVPKWAKNGETIFYQIFLDRFFSSGNAAMVKLNGRNCRKWGEMPNYTKNEEGEFHNNDFFLGNIEGIIKKLSYLKKLGVTVLYLSPIVYSKFRYDRYAATDYMMIDPNAGTFETLRILHEKANKMKMHIVLDMAFNHCSSDNPIFQDAIANPNSKFRKWFYINDDGTYAYWYGEFKDMPIFNQHNKEYQNYVFGENGIIDLYAKYVDGFRLDVSEELNLEFLEGIRKRANENGAHLIIGECWKKVPLEKIGVGIDTPTNYLFTDAIYKIIVDNNYEYFKWIMKDVLENYPEETIATMLNSLDTHDTVRALTCLKGNWMRNDRERWKIDDVPSKWHKTINGKIVFLTQVFRDDEAECDRLPPKEYRKAKGMLKAASVIQYFLPGCPCIFYGTEVGLHGYKDPFNRKCFPWNYIDKSLLRHFIRLGKTRRSNKEALSDANFQILDYNDKVLKFTRNNLLIIVNTSDKYQKVKVPKEYQEAEKVFKVGVKGDKFQPYGALVLKKE